MTSRTQTASKSHRYTIPKGSWTCCKCLTPNSGVHHVCDGIVPYQDIYEEICSHWHCSSCARLSEGTPSYSLLNSSSLTSPRLQLRQTKPYLVHTPTSLPLLLSHLPPNSLSHNPRSIQLLPPRTTLPSNQPLLILLSSSTPIPYSLLINLLLYKSLPPIRSRRSPPGAPPHNYDLCRGLPGTNQAGH